MENPRAGAEGTTNLTKTSSLQVSKFLQSITNKKPFIIFFFLSPVPVGRQTCLFRVGYLL